MRKPYRVTVRGDNGDTTVTVLMTEAEADIVRYLSDEIAEAEHHIGDRILLVEEAA